MKGYNSANGDKRGILERFLPTTYRTTDDGSNAHNAFFGAIKNSIETTRDDVENISLQVYFTKATGRFLDLYGKYIGLSRNTDESDESYRDRLVSYIKTKRGTIDAIISGIRNELNDPDVPVSIYETWRNIFILNQSKLNGLDYIMGEKYRYAVIEVTIGKYVEPDILKDIVSRYKAYGVLVIYRYSLGITDNYYDSVVDFSDNYYNSDKEYSTIPATEPYFKNYTVTLGDSPLTTDDINSFTTNKSNINGTDVLSGNPENAYIYDYSKSPSHHIIGYVPDTDKIANHADVYSYIYDNNVSDSKYNFTTEPYLVTSKKDSNYFNFSVPKNSSLILGVDTLSFLRNNGYTDKIKSYSPTSISAINVYTKGTEVGLPPTAISPIASNGDAITGSFSGKSTVTDPTVSSGKYTFTFTKSSSLKSVNVIDYYKFGMNTRIITLKSNNLELPLSVSNNQVTGTVYSPDYLTPMKPVVVSYTNKFTLDIISNSNNIYIYNFTKSMWELYKDSIFTISDYIEDSTKISGSYMLIKISGSNIRLNYFALNINSVNIQ